MTDDLRPPALRATGLVRRYGDLEVIGGLDLAVAPNEVVAIVGPSGCGKTTLLNALAGFEPPDAGSIDRAGRTRTIHQADGLFPWLTARQNVALGLGDQASPEQDRRVAELLDLVGLTGFEDHQPHQLSGGMRQRAELARALAGDAPILLLDEPFSALDYQTRLRMRHELARLLAVVPRTVVLVTHDIEEAVQLADRVIVLSARPARVSLELRLTGERPRDLSIPAVVEAAAAIRDALGLGEPAAKPAPAAPPPALGGGRLSWGGVGVAALLGITLAVMGRHGPEASPGAMGLRGAEPASHPERAVLRVGHLPVT